MIDCWFTYDCRLGAIAMHRPIMCGNVDISLGGYCSVDCWGAGCWVMMVLSVDEVVIRMRARAHTHTHTHTHTFS